MIATIRPIVTTALLPLAVAYLLISYLLAPGRINTSELFHNDLLVHTHPIMRKISDPDILIVALGSSGILLLTTMLWAFLVAVPAGISYGWSTSVPMRRIAWAISTVAAALPTFFWAVVIELLMIFLWIRFQIRVVPIAGFGTDGHLVLPSLALGMRPAAYIFRLTATAVDEIRHTDYMRTALAKGLPGRILLARHILPNAAPNIITATLLATRGALSGLVIVDLVYIWGGAGLTFLQALATYRLALATELALAFAVVSVALVLLAELARSRIRAAG